MRALILLVDGTRTTLRRTEALLSDAGHLVAAVSSFERATTLLYSVSPDLLVASTELGGFTGLDLATLSRQQNPQLPIILTHASADPVLERETARHGGTLLVNHLENPAFLPAVQSALDEHRRTQPMIRRWRRKRVMGLVEARLPRASARILDISYGGVRLTYENERTLPAAFDVTVPTAGLIVQAHLVWTRRSPTTGELLSGAELSHVGTSYTDQWRGFIDAIC
jgi:CheY-like chemotaxis protein